MWGAGLSLGELGLRFDVVELGFELLFLGRCAPRFRNVEAELDSLKLSESSLEHVRWVLDSSFFAMLAPSLVSSYRLAFKIGFADRPGTKIC